MFNQKMLIYKLIIFSLIYVENGSKARFKDFLKSTIVLKFPSFWNE